jgi:5,10-methylenetetrahydrofolate reductase
VTRYFMGLQRAISTKSFTLSADLTPLADGASMVEQARRLLGSVDVVQITDSPTGVAQASSLAVGAVLRQAGIDPVLHMSCRDRNRLALHGDLLGAATLGLSSLLVVRGSPLRTGLRSNARPVFDIGAIDLIAAARELRDTESPGLLGLSRAPDLFIGGMMTVFDAARAWQPRAVLAKIGAGAQFLQSQLCFDVPLLRRYMKQFVAMHLTQQCYVMVGLASLPSAETACWLRDNLRRALIPDETIRRLKQATDPELAGIQICAEILRDLSEIPGVSGANFLAPSHPEVLKAVIGASGLRAQQGKPQPGDRQ